MIEPIFYKEIRGQLKFLREIEKSYPQDRLPLIRAFNRYILANLKNLDDGSKDFQHLLFEIDDDLDRINKKIEKK